MKKILGLSIALLLFVLTGSLINPQICKAASAEVNITSDNADIAAGDNIIVNIEINSDTSFGDFEANITYDSDVLEYQEGPSFITGDGGFLKISNINVSEGSTERKYALKFKALKAGSSVIAFNGPAIVYEFDTGNDMAVSSNEYTVNVKAPVTASANADLKSLKISPSALSPEFDKKVYNYSTSVGYETDKLIVDAVSEDSKATVKITGNDSLKEGENKVIVTVIAESGAVIEYTINVNREAAPAATGTPTLTPDAKHGTFEVADVNGELIATYGGTYKLIEPGQDVVIPDGYNKTQIIVSGISIDVYEPEDALKKDFLLIYAENKLGEKGFYQYDRKEGTLQRFVLEGIGAYDDTQASANNAQALTKDYRSKLNAAIAVIALLSVLCAFLLVLSVRLFMKSKGYKDDDLD